MTDPTPAPTPAPAAPQAGGFGAGARVVTAANASILIALATAVVIVLNLVVASVYTRWDWTSAGALALSERTREFLAVDVDRQKEPVRLYVFYPPHTAFAVPQRRDEVFAVHHLAREFDMASENIVLETLDPEANRGRVDQLRAQFKINDTEFLRGVVAFQFRNRQKYLTDLQLFETDFEAMKAAGGGVQVPRRFMGEDRFLGALWNLVEGESPKAAILVGHGELDPQATGRRTAKLVQQALLRDTYEVDVLDLKGFAEIRKPYDVIIILDPRQPLPATAVKALSGHLDRGGGLLVCAGPNLDPRPDGQVLFQPTGLEGLLKQWGLHLGEDLIHMSAKNPLGQELQFADSFAPMLDHDHPITRALITERGRYVYFPAPIRSVKHDDQGRNKTQGWTLAATDERGIRVTDFVAYFQAIRNAAALRKFLEGLEPEKVSIGAAAESIRPAAGGHSTRLVVFGASSWCDDAPPHGFYDMDLFMSAANWISRRESLAGIGAKDPAKVRFDMTDGQKNLVFWLGILFLPCGVGALGWIVWLLRKREGGK